MRIPRPFFPAPLCFGICSGICFGLAALCLPAPARAGAAISQEAIETQAVPGPASAGGQTEEVLRAIEENYLRAEMEDNATLAGSILAEDFLGIKSDGGALNRDQVLNNLSQHARGGEPYRVAAANMREHVFGDTACVTYTKIYTLPGTARTYSENVLHIFTQRNGRWQLQVSSLIPETTPRNP